MILIAGDSWSVGEWTGHGAPENVGHNGLAQYFAEAGNTVINLGEPGGANFSAHQRIWHFLLANQFVKVDRILIFQTEWFRDLDLNNRSRLSLPILETSIIREFYMRLDTLARRLDLHIDLVGGCSDTINPDQIETEYQNLKVVCQSLVNLVVHGQDRVPDPVFATFTNRSMIEHLKNLYRDDVDSTSFLLDRIDQGLKRIKSLESHPDWFRPDGYHANRQAHYRLYEFLKEKKYGA